MMWFMLYRMAIVQEVGQWFELLAVPFLQLVDINTRLNHLRMVYVWRSCFSKVVFRKED